MKAYAVVVRGSGFSHNLLLSILFCFLVCSEKIFGEAARETARENIVKILKVTKDRAVIIQNIGQNGGQDDVKIQKIRLLGLKLLQKNVLEMYLRLANFDEPAVSRSLLSIEKSLDFMKKKLKKGSTFYIDPLQREHPLTNEPLYLIRLPTGTYLNTEMTREGLAYPDLKLLDKKWKIKFMSAYQESIQKKKGLWKLWNWKDSFPGARAQERLSYAGQKKVSVLTYNLENLFDTKMDSIRDTTYLPMELKKTKAHRERCGRMRYGRKKCLEFDWSEKKLGEKLRRIAQVILRADPRGGGADIILLEELENYDVLRRLVETHLAGQGYEIYHAESRDFRGIDTAVLSKLKLSQVPRYHEIKFKRRRATRGILETTFFLPNKELLTVFPFHFPSQFSSTLSRSQALTFLDRFIKYLPKERYILGGGDCNITKEEEPELYSNHLKDWGISHQIGCGNCQGTYYYRRKKTWSFFDVFYFSKNLNPASPPSKTSWAVDPSSIRIINDLPFQNEADKTPRSFQSVNENGVSDHWPLYIEIRRLEATSAEKAR